MSYSDRDTAALYDLLNPWGPSDAFYLGLVMDARSVLDVGCGTGALLHRARRDGHAGRLCGVDPDVHALEIARCRDDIEWHDCRAATMPWAGEFELAVMTGHAFQCLVGDDEVRASLDAIHRALVDGGCFAFETRNPATRAWKGWTPARTTVELVDPAGRTIQVWNAVEAVTGDVVTVSETIADRDGTELRKGVSDLRFLAADRLAAFLDEAGFRIEAQYGDWDRTPVTPASPEIITIARR